MNNIKQLSVALLLLVFVAGCGAKKEGQSTQSPQTIAEYMQQAHFATLDGDTVAVADFKGKVVMVDFWETWCKPCIASFPGIQKLTREYPDNFVVLAVTPGFSDTPAAAKQFVQNHDYDFTYLYDVNGLSKQLQIPGIPYKAFIDARGNFVKTTVGSAGPAGDYEHIKKIIEANKSPDL